MTLERPVKIFEQSSYLFFSPIAAILLTTLKDQKVFVMGKRSVITQEEILEHAYALAAAEGLQALSIRSVANDCDVAVGTIYNSYASKTELINDVVGMFWQRAFTETMDMVTSHNDKDFVAFCSALSQSLKAALKTFKKDFLSELSALSTTDRLSAQKREQQSFSHAREGIKRALCDDPRIKQERLTGPLDPERLSALIWEAMLDSARDDTTYDETLFALLAKTLY